MKYKTNSEHKLFNQAICLLFPKIKFFLLAESVNVDLLIPEKCTSDTLFYFKAYVNDC